MNAMQNFVFEEHLVRTIDLDGDPWFIGSDVCNALAIKNAPDALSRLDADEKRPDIAITDTSGTKYATGVSEAGVYRLVFSSRKAEAERFKRWLAHDVLPQIRKTGSYGAVANSHPFFDEGRPAVMDTLPTDRRQALAEVREARLIYGTMAARLLWEASPHLPQLAHAGRAEEISASPSGEVLRTLLEIILDDDMRNVREAIAANDADALEAIGMRLVPGGAWLLPRHPRLWPRWQATRWRDGHWVTMLKRLDDVTGGHERMSIGGHQGRPLWLPASLLA